MKKNIFKNIPLLLFLLVIFWPMLNSKFGFFLLVVAVLSLVYYYLIFAKLKGGKNPFAKFANSNNPNIIDLDKLKNMNNIKRITFTAIIAVFALWLFFASIVIVDAGETGVYSLFGKVSDEELRSGFHLVIPLAKVTKMSIRTEEYTMSIVKDEGKKTGADAITSLTKEGLSVDLDMTVLYSLDEPQASDVYKNVGLQYVEKIIRPAIRTAIRDVIAQYEAKDIYSEKKGEVSKMIEEKLTAELGPRGIKLESVLLRNVALPANLATAIQEKLQAEQEAQKYDFILEKERKEKERKVIEAEGQRDAQKIINESLSTNYLYYLYIKELKDREGTIYVPTSPDTGLPLFRNLGN